MAKIDSGSKSSRLLASRRYTHDTLTTAQESFTNVLDLQSSEVYTQAHLIPTSSLSHSGSTQFGAVYSTGGQNVTKYWYRHKLTPSNINNETWFFINPTGSDDGVGAQLINDNQEVSFVSPKYSVAALATSTVEDSTPGYLAVIYKSSAVSQSFQSQSLVAGEKVSTNDYQFDYKTGVVQFINSSSAPPDAEYVYMSVYQYVGKTLATGLDISGNVSGSSISTGSFGRVEASTFSGDGSALTGVTAGALDIDSATDGTSATVATTDLLLFSDGGTEKKMQIKQMAAPLASVISGSFTALSASLADTGSFGRVEAAAIIVSNDLTVTDDLFVDDFARIDALRVGTTSTDPGDGHAYIEGNLTVAGTLTSQEFHTEVTSGSILFTSGSTIFGDSIDDTHEITGSVTVSGSLEVQSNVSGSSVSTGSFGRVEASTVTGTLATAAQANVTSVGTLSTLTLGGDLLVPEYIKHVGDTDTFIQFEADEINVKVGGENMIYLNEGGGGDQADKVTINNNLADVDFQVKGDNEANLIRTVATSDRVGIGTSTPGVTLEVVGSISGSATKTGSFGQVETQGFGITAKSIISGSFTAASSSIDTRIEGIADPIAMAIALGG